MLGGRWVLTEHIVCKTLSTSLTLFRASSSQIGEEDALEAEVSDGREDEFHHGVVGVRKQRHRGVRGIRHLQEPRYRYIKRYLQEGVLGLEEQSRAPRNV